MKTRILSFLILMLLSLAAACSGNSFQEPKAAVETKTPSVEPTSTPVELTKQDVTCIEPLTKLAFPVWGSDRLPERDESFILPQDDFEAVNCPAGGCHVAINLIFQGDDTLWLTSSSNGAWRYHIPTNTWEEMNLLDGKFVHFNFLFKGPDEEIWAFDRFPREGSDDPLLMRFDEKSNQFVTILDTEGELTSQLYKLLGDPVVDGEGIIWLLLKKGDGAVLASFDPQTLSLEERTIISETSNKYSGLTLGPDGNFWLVDREGKRLLYFDVEAQALGIYDEIPEGESGITSLEDGWQYMTLYVDRQQRMWITDYGWLQFSSEGITWYKIVRSPAFIYEFPTDYGYYRWDRPESIYHSTQNEYWFSSYVGVVRLDPEQAEWCLVSTIPGAFAEDTSGNIWLAVFDKIYLYKK